MTGMRIVEVSDLGEEAVIVEGEGDKQPLLLLDAGLSWEERMDILDRVMGEESA